MMPPHLKKRQAGIRPVRLRASGTSCRTGCLSQELAVLEQRVGRDRSWRILGLLTADDVNGF